ncbi:MAG: NAD(P)H-binding protein, partial [Pseudomonadales bacterium]|nr:NAD(P)H-binding protein [Pseudomonadales bacterium]
MTTLIIGANGKIGQLVCQQGSALGMDLLGMVRNTEQAPNLEKLGARTVVADLEGEFSHAFDGVSKVVFTAGSGSHTGADKTLM